MTTVETERANRFRQATKLHQILELALEDLMVVERNPAYVVTMDSWHSPDEEEAVCAVCLGGAVMAHTLGASPKDYLHPSHYRLDDQVMQKLRALDFLRTGNVGWALEVLRQTADCLDIIACRADMHSLTRQDLPDYGAHSLEWWQIMRYLLTDLKNADL